MMIRINKAHFPVTVLGHGRRLGIWFQGCPIRCAGCISRDTWEDDPGREMPLDTLLCWCRATSGGNLDGITITGGEPFHQPAALKALLKGLRGWAGTLASPVDILCYTGFGLDSIKHTFPEILALIDIIIPGPFISSLPGVSPLCGSGNQVPVPLSPLGRGRCDVSVGVAAVKRMQARGDAGGIWFVGIPERGDMERIRQNCSEKGLIIEEMSWDR